MARVTVEDCLTKVANRFELVLVSSKRARQLATGGKDPFLEWENDKPTVMALREIAEGYIDRSILIDKPNRIIKPESPAAAISAELSAEAPLAATAPEPSADAAPAEEAVEPPISTVEETAEEAPKEEAAAATAEKNAEKTEAASNEQPADTSTQPGTPPTDPA